MQDLFTEASDTLISAHTPDSGGAWNSGQVGGANEPLVVGGAGIVRMRHADHHVVTNADNIGVLDYYAEAVGVASPAGNATSLNRLGVVVRASTGNYYDMDGYIGAIGSNGHWVVMRLNGGTLTTLAEASNPLPGFDAQAAHTVRLRVTENGADPNAADYVLTVDGEVIASGTDGSAITSIGRTGLYAFAFSDEPEIDSFETAEYAVNQSPTLDTPVPDQSVAENSVVVLDFSGGGTYASDPDGGQTLTASIQGALPSHCVFDAETEQLTIHPLVGDAAGAEASVDITVRWTDDGEPPLYVEDTFTVNVTPYVGAYVNLEVVTYRGYRVPNTPINWAWFDAAPNDAGLASLHAGEGLVTNANARVTIPIPDTTLNEGDTTGRLWFEYVDENGVRHAGAPALPVQVAS